MYNKPFFHLFNTALTSLLVVFALTSAAQQTPSPTAGELLGPRATPPKSSALNPQNWTQGPDGKLYAPVGRKDATSNPMPDLELDQPLLTINGTAVTWGAVLRHTELLMSEMRVPQGVTHEQFEAERANLTMRRIYSICRNHTSKTVLAQEALRRGVSLTPAEVDAKDKEVVAKIREVHKAKADNYLKIFHAPNSFYYQDLTNTLLLTKLEQDIIRPSVKITSADIRAGFAARKKENQEIKKYNRDLRPQLEETRREILAGETSFADAAFIVSECGSSHENGEVGTKKLEDLEPNMVQALLKLEPGKLSEIVETPYSFHILKLNRLNRGFLPEGATGDPPIVSVNFAHIMVEKKEPLPDLSRKEMEAKLLDETVEAKRDELQQNLLAAADIQTPLQVGLDDDQTKPAATRTKPRRGSLRERIKAHLDTQGKNPPQTKPPAAE